MDYNNFNDNETQENAPHHCYILNGEPVYDEDRHPQAKQKKKRNPAPILFIILSIIVLAFRLASNFADNIFEPEEDYYYSNDVVENTGSAPVVSDEPDARGTVHYSYMVYERPDVDAMFAKIDHVIEVCNTLSYDELTLLIDDVYLDYWHFDTMYWLADTKNCTDVTDEYYREECLYLNTQSPLIEQKIEEMLFALAACPIAAELDEDYYGGDFLVYYTGESTYNNDLVALMQRESELILEYQTLMGAPTIEIDGETVNVEEYLAEHADDDVKYYEALELYYEEYGILASEIYVELVKTRHEISDLLGYASYIDYAYASYSRDYTPDDVREYVSTVCLGVAPLYLDMYYSGELYDYYLPGELTAEENQAALEACCREMGGRVWDIYCYMSRNGLFDVEVSPVKVNMSYQVYFEDWQAPFVFLDATGTLDDYLGFSHEFGHFIDAYINYNSYITTDASESCSQSMEFLSVIYSSYLGDDSETVKRLKMVDLVTLYTEQGAYNAFEEAIYAIPVDELTPEIVRQTARDIYMQYGLLVPEDDPIYENMWIEIPHFFTNPFYIVSYIVSNDAAIQIYEQELNNPGEGIETFVALCDRRWDLNYIENMENIGLDASFSVDRANAIVDMIYSYFE